MSEASQEQNKVQPVKENIPNLRLVFFQGEDGQAKIFLASNRGIEGGIAMTGSTWKDIRAELKASTAPVVVPLCPIVPGATYDDNVQLRWVSEKIGRNYFVEDKGKLQ